MTRVGEAHRFDQREQCGAQGGPLLVVQGSGGGGGPAVVCGQLAADGHVQLHLQGGEQEDGGAVHVGDDVVAVGAPGGVEVALQVGERGRLEGAGDGPEEADLAGVVFGRHELLQVAEVVEGEGQAVGVAGIAVGQRHLVVHQRHAPAARAL